MFRLFIVYSFIILNISIRVSLPQNFTYSDDIEEPVPRVVNGWPANLGDVPYQLAFKALASRNTQQYVNFCGGTIIGPDKVLSAAHCFDKIKITCNKCWGLGEVSKLMLETTFAVAGNLASKATYSHKDSMSNGQWRRLKSMHLNKLYNFPKNDICVGFTTLPFKFNGNVGFIPYATQYREYVGKCLVSGYGMISSKQRSEKLLLAHLDLFNTSWCSRVHQRNMREFVCTSSQSVSDVQHGDSGGPLVCLGTNDKSDSGKGVIVGVVSGNRPGAGTFFTRVSSFKEFIDAGRGCVIRANVLLMCLLHFGLLLF